MQLSVPYFCIVEDFMSKPRKPCSSYILLIHYDSHRYIATLVLYKAIAIRIIIYAFDISHKIKAADEK